MDRWINSVSCRQQIMWLSCDLTIPLGPVKELSLSSLSSTFKQITLIHFNDVYNIEPREKEPVGGASRFKTALETLSDKNPMVLFSGDALAPSNSQSHIRLIQQYYLHLSIFGSVIVHYYK